MCFASQASRTASASAMAKDLRMPTGSVASNGGGA